MSDHGQALTDGGDTGEAAHEEHGNRFYFITWLWLLIITAAEVGLAVVVTHGTFLVVSLLVLTVMKAALIVGNFMHVRFERLNFLPVALAPFVTAVVMYIGMWYDFIEIPR